MNSGFIKPYITKRDKPARCNEGPLDAGNTVWLIQYPNGKYYYFCYKLQPTAVKVMDRLTGRENDHTVTSDPDNCLYSTLEL